MSQSNFVSLCGYFMSCDTPWLSRLCEFSTWRVFQLSFKNIQIIFLELSAGQIRQNCRATLVIPPGTSVATIVTICCNHRDGEYFLHRITRKLGSTATSTVITRLLPLTNYISGAENETQRALLGHTNGNIEMRSPSAAAMLTMVAAATIVRFPPVTGNPDTLIPPLTQFINQRKKTSFFSNWRLTPIPLIIIFKDPVVSI